MKKKLMIYTSLLLFITLFIITVLFISIVNVQYENSLKEQLRTNNSIISQFIEDTNSTNINYILNKIYKNSDIRVTYVDKYGKVIYDSVADLNKMENHNNREEIIIARKKGEGFDKRISKTTGIKTIYFAKKVDNDKIIRSSIAVNKILKFDSSYIKDYIFILIFVFLITIIFSFKLSYLILKPIEDLDFVTSRIAKGELDKRANIAYNDEIGELARNFNKMADKLQSSLNDSIQKQNKLEAILKSMDSGVIAVDRNLKVIMINPYAQKIFKLNQNVIGNNLLDYIRSRDIEKALREPTNESQEITLKHDQNTKVLRIKTAEIINRSEHIGTVAVVQDITDIKKLENMRSQFVANVSHELKTPLTSIKGFTETLQYVDDDETKRKFLNIINDEAERLTRLLNDILTLSNIEQNIELKNEKIDVNRIIENVYNLMLNIAKKRNIKLCIETKKVPYLIGDTDRFKQMLINLIDNAIKYSESGGVVTVGTRLENNDVVIYVKDTGIGIPKEHLKRIFERFYRVDKARSRANGGTGLGLAIVKHIVLSMNGTISVKSKVNVGTIFTIKIPYSWE